MIWIESLASDTALHQALYEAIHNAPLSGSVSYLPAATRFKLCQELKRRHCVNPAHFSKVDIRRSGILKAVPIPVMDGMARPMNDELHFISDGLVN